jgi:hypothetical protein
VGWEIYAGIGAAAAVVVGVIYIAMRMIRKEARAVGGEREAREKLEEFIELDKKRHALDGLPVPLGKREQSRRLRVLLEARERDRD